MYHLAHHSIRRSLCQRRNALLQNPQRKLSSTSGSSSNNAAIAAGVVGAGVIGTVAYAQYDENFKSSLPSWLGGGSKPAVTDILEAPFRTAPPQPLHASPQTDEAEVLEIENKDEVLPIMDTPEDEATTISPEPIEEPVATEDLPSIIEEAVADDSIESQPADDTQDSPVVLEIDEPVLVSDEAPTVEPVSEDAAVTDESPEIVEGLEEEAPAAVTAVEEAIDPVFEGQVVETPAPEESVEGSEVVAVEDVATVTEEEPAPPVEPVILDPVGPLATVIEHLNACSIACHSAASVNQKAANAVIHHSEMYEQLVHSVSDEEKTEQMETLNAALSERDDLLQEADQSYFAAVEELEATKKALESVPVKTEDGELNEELVSIERSWVNLSDKLEHSRNAVNENKSKSKITAFVASIKTGSESSTQGLTLGEKAQILSHLQDYIATLKQTIIDTQQEGIKKMEEAVLVAKQETEEHERLVSARVLQNALDDLKKDHDAELFKASQEFEQEMTAQLKRQAAAHAQHLADAISYQTEQLNQKHEEILSITVAETEDAFRKELAEQKANYILETEALKDQTALALELATARVKGLSEALTGSAIYESESRKAQELSLACDSLLHALKYGNNGKPVPLSTQIETVRKVCHGNESVEALTDAFSNVVATRGVYTEDTLRASFKQIGKLCRQVSLVDKDHSSLFVYFLSYVKNILTFAPSISEPPQEIDVTELEPFNIVAYANYCLQLGELEQAARFVNQLKGESRKVAEEWLSEARLLIETKQTTEALNLVSSAFVIAAQLSE